MRIKHIPYYFIALASLIGALFSGASIVVLSEMLQQRAVADMIVDQPITVLVSLKVGDV